MRHRKGRSWRHQLAPTKKKKTLRSCLMVVLILECSFGTMQVLSKRLQILPLIQTEHSVQVEWMIPKEEGEPKNQEVYGVQFRWKEGEILFYRQSEEINGH